jgi:hypothetical protein
VNPFNPEAGATPAPVDPAIFPIVERAAIVIWRAFPYFEWRFGARGRAFGRSDAGYLATLVALPPALQEQQVSWLAKLLSSRGMPSLLLEVQLDLLGRVGQRAGWAGATRMRELGVALRARRQPVMPDEQLRRCEQHFLARTASLPRRRSVGMLIAAEVADVRLGYVADSEATIGWLVSHGPADEHWRLACAETRALAQECPGAAP